MGTDVQVGSYWLTITFFHFDTTRLWLTYILLLPLSCAHTYLPFALCSVSLMISIYRPIQFYYYALHLVRVYILSVIPMWASVKATLLNRTITSKFGLIFELPATRVNNPEQVQHPLSNV